MEIFIHFWIRNIPRGGGGGGGGVNVHVHPRIFFSSSIIAYIVSIVHVHVFVQC